MARRQKKPDKEPNHERWLITYADLITLLLIFFVVMYSMSQISAAKYAAVANSLSVVLSGQAMSLLETQGPSLAQGISGQQMTTLAHIDDPVFAEKIKARQSGYKASFSGDKISKLLSLAGFSAKRKIDGSGK